MRTPIGRKVIVGVLSAASFLLGCSALPGRAVSSGSPESPADLRRNALGLYMEKRGVAPSDAFNSALTLYQLAIRRATEKFGADSTYVADLYFEVGSLALESANFNKAQEYLEHAVKLNPNSVMAHLKLAEFYERQGRHDLSLHEIQNALAKNPKSLEARASLVRWLEHHNVSSAIRESATIMAATGPRRNDARAKLAVAPVIMPSPIAKPAAETPTPDVEPVNSSILNRLRRVGKPEQETKPEPEPVKEKPKEEAKKPEAKPKPDKKEKPEKKDKKEKKEKEKEHKEKAKKAEKPKHEKKDAVGKKEALPLVPRPEEQNFGELKALVPTAASLKTSVKVKKSEDSESRPEPKPKTKSENETADNGWGDNNAVQTYAPAPMPRAEAPVKRGRHASFIPPPPPTTPAFGSMPPQAMPMRAAPKRAKPVESAAPAAPEKPVATGSDDPEFIIEWAGVKDKKKRAHKTSD